MVRKTRKSLSESVLAELERKVLPPSSPLLSGADRQHRSKYAYPNGSEVILAGLDDVSRIMSSQFDVVYVAEATEITEHDLEILVSRLRNNALRDKKTGQPWHQVICDCNPCFPSHWLKKRCDREQMTYIESRHEDNPACTPDYLERLRQLSGVRRKRLYSGLWVAAEGAVYSEWDRNVHLLDCFEILDDWLRIRVIDFGFRDPFVCLWLAVDPESRLYVYRQLYMTGRLVEDHAKDILQLSRHEHISATICDHDAEGRGTLERRGIRTLSASKSILTGIQAVQARLRLSSDGKPRLFVLNDSLVERDPTLLAAKKPTCIEEEFEAYEWAAQMEDQVLKETPIDRDNHALDALRYGIIALRRMEKIRSTPPSRISIYIPLSPQLLYRNGRF